MKKRVLLVGNTELTVFGFRGELIERLVKDGYEVYTCFSQSDFGDGYTSAIKYGCSYIPVEISRHGTNPINEIRLFFKFKLILKRVNPDIVLTYTIKPNIYMGLASSISRIPYVVNVSGLGKLMTENMLIKAIVILLYKLSLRNVQTIFFQNTSNEKFFAKYKIKNGTHKILPGSGVNLEKFTVLPFPSDDDIGFLFMARIIEEKGINQYLDAAKEIKKKYPNTTFYVIGHCDDEHYLSMLNELTDEGIIEYEGLQADVIPYLMKTQCTVLPTYYAEGLSNVLVESAASGRAVITTNRSGSGETVDDGKTGYYVEAHDTEDLIRVLEKFLNLSNVERKQMGLYGRKKVEKEFDRQLVVEQYMKEICDG